MMRRTDVVVLDAFQLQCFEHARLPLHLFFQQPYELALTGHHLVQLLDLMFEMRNVSFKPFESLLRFIVHADEGSQFFPAKQTTSTAAIFLHVQNAAGKSKAGSATETGSSVIGSS
jgi:hypothetical protein